MSKFTRATVFLVGSSTLAFSSVPAVAQSADVSPKPQSGTQSSSQTAALTGNPANGEIVVTGTSSRQLKFNAPYSVSTIDRRRIDQLAPHSVADLLKSTPGITVEASGGVGGGENVVIRGLPWSGWRLIDLNQDGMPLFETNTERYVNIDQIYRVDFDTKRAEVVRGGTAPIYASNAAGGVINFITGHGTPDLEGAVRIGTGTGEAIRGDVYVSGPLSHRLMGTVSGFYRKDNGLRDAGFKNADLGGQIKVGATYNLGGGKIWADVKYLNDRNVFYTDVPLTSPINGASLESLIDPRNGTLTSDAFRHVTLRTTDANFKPTTVNRDLQDGIHSKAFTATVGGDYDLGSGFRIADTYRHTKSTIQFNALFNGAPTNATTYLASRLNAARTAFGAGVTSLRYVVADTNTVYDPATTANLVMPNTWGSVTSDLRYDANDVRLTKSFDTGVGRHSFTAGLFYSSYHYDQIQLLNSILTNVKNQPIALDIQALNASGQVVGSVTENGFIAYGAGSQSGSVDGHETSLYLADTWQITPAWSVDVGIRRVKRDQHGLQGKLGTVVADPAGPIPARSVLGVTSYVPHTDKPAGTSWTVGTGYIFSRHANAFARYTHTFSYPRFDNILGGATLPGTTQQLPTATVQQAEGGVKYSVPGFSIVATGFWSKFDKLNGGTQVADANGLITNSNIIFNSKTYGLELETVLSPLDRFQITVSGMIQNPKITNVQTLTGLNAQSSEGGDIPRIPRYQFTIEPSYSFEVASIKARVFTSIFTIGRRFQDYSNLSRLPAYTSFDIGASLTTMNGFEVNAVVNNVANVVGLTEGNARAAAIAAGPVADATVGRSIFGRNFTLSLTKRW